MSFSCPSIIVGSAMNVKSVIDITDAMMIALCVPNIITLYVLAPEIKKDLIDYCQRHNICLYLNRDWRLKPAAVAVTADALENEDDELCQNK